MTTAIIGTGGIGSAIARQLAAGGETLGLSSADQESARTLAAQTGRGAVAAAGNRDALRGADAVVLALRFTALKNVIDEIADALTDKVVVVPSNPLTTDADGSVSRVLPEGQSSGEVVAGWLPAEARLAMAFGTLSAGLFESSSNRSPEPAVLFYATDDDRAGEEVERLIRVAGFEPVKAGGVEYSGRLEVGGDLHDLVVGAAEGRSLAGKGRAAMPAATHQPDQAVFRSVLSEDVDWEPFPGFPPAARLAVVVGNPSEPGPYVVRVKLPSGQKLMPHRHHEDRVYTVISGVFYIGLGDKFDETRLEAYPPGSVVVLPGDTPHFHWARSGEYVTQVTAIGPISLVYVDPHDDPRN
jgi:predicted dinucleotide-binding enzyme/quercetin dioxygenase-like cupin family protein